MPVYHCAKIHSHQVMNFLEKCAFLDLADFWLIFRFFECTEVCAFISRKLNKLRFTFPNNFSPGILITKSIPPEGQGSGLQCPKIGLRTQNFKIFTFSHAPCDQMVRPRGSVTALFCITEGPLTKPLPVFKLPLQYCLQGPWGAHP